MITRLLRAPTLALSLALVGLAIVPGRVHAGSLAEVADFGANPGRLRMFAYVADQAAPNAPLVVALHGCNQDAAEYQNAGWNALADAHGFHMLYPQQSALNNFYMCLTWWGGELTRGADENQSIVNMVQHMIATHGVDPDRVFVTGLSAGAAVAVNLLAMWPDVFAAGGVIAGIPYGCATSLSAATGCTSPGVDRTATDWGDRVRDVRAGTTATLPRISLWQGTADSVVAIANLGELLEQWRDVHGLLGPPVVDEVVAGAQHQVFGDAQGGNQVEVYRMTGVDHGTPIDLDQGCGSPGAYFLNIGLCSSLRMAEFFGIVGGAAGDGGTATDSGSALDGNSGERSSTLDARAADARGTADGAARDHSADAQDLPDLGHADAGWVAADAGVADGGAGKAAPGCACTAQRGFAPGSLLMLCFTVLAALAWSRARHACRTGRGQTRRQG